MGVKIAVVGGGSTYTPELVEGIAARADRLPIDELVLLDTDPERLEIVGGLARRMLDRLGWTGRLRCTGDRDAARRRRRLRARPAARRRPGRAARRRDAAADGSARSARRRPAPAGSPRRSGPCRSSSTSPRSRGARRAGRLDRRFHEPGRDRHPGAARRRPSGDRAVQRRDQRSSAARRAVRRRRRSGSSSSTSGSTT